MTGSHAALEQPTIQRISRCKSEVRVDGLVAESHIDEDEGSVGVAEFRSR